MTILFCVLVLIRTVCEAEGCLRLNFSAAYSSHFYRESVSYRIVIETCLAQI